jgi:hypothetical protein
MWLRREVSLESHIVHVNREFISQPDQQLEGVVAIHPEILKEVSFRTQLGQTTARLVCNHLHDLIG